MKPGIVGRSLWSLLTALLGLALLAALFYFAHVPVKTLISLLAQTNKAAFGAITLCSVLYAALGAVKWRLITGKKAPRPFFYAHYTAQAMLIGQFLPPPVAIAVNRAAVMKLKQKTPLKKGFFNALYDMGFDFLIALLLVPVSFLQLVLHFHIGVWLAAGLAMTVAAGLLAILAGRFIPSSWLNKLGFETSPSHNLLAPRLICLLLLLSALRFALVTIRLIFGALAIGLAVPWSTIIYATPPATMPSLFFLTPANLGIAEWSWAYLFTLWGATAISGTLYATSFRILVLLAQALTSLFFWILYLGAARKEQS